MSLNNIAVMRGHDKDFQKIPVTIQFDRKVQNKSPEYILGSK